MITFNISDNSDLLKKNADCLNQPVTTDYFSW